MLRTVDSLERDNDRLRMIHQFKAKRESHGAFLVAFKVPDFLKLEVKQSQVQVLYLKYSNISTKEALDGILLQGQSLTVELRH